MNNTIIAQQTLALKENGLLQIDVTVQMTTVIQITTAHVKVCMLVFADSSVK
jgi:hypothetical protein